MIRYLRCPCCGKLSRLRNFQVHDAGGKHRFPDVMIQEIVSGGRGKIGHKWHSAKLDRETRIGLNKYFALILSRLLEDIGEVVEVEGDDDIVELKEPDVKEKKRKGRRFKVEDEREEAVEVWEESESYGTEDEDVALESGEEDYEVDNEDELFSADEEEIYSVR